MWFSSFDWIIVAIAVGGFFIYRDITRHIERLHVELLEEIEKGGQEIKDKLLDLDMDLSRRLSDVENAAGNLSNDIDLGRIEVDLSGIKLDLSALQKSLDDLKTWMEKNLNDERAAAHAGMSVIEWERREMLPMLEDEAEKAGITVDELMIEETGMTFEDWLKSPAA
jgi:hypothetical protein